MKPAKTNLKRFLKVAQTTAEKTPWRPEWPARRVAARSSRNDQNSALPDMSLAPPFRAQPGRARPGTAQEAGPKEFAWEIRPDGSPDD